ncbi:hypothetical protein NLI96_g9623 [Meripilus lineatus]|uniref:DUF396-domain-containing protein n=1 Tax=Meripilus lineatus TaxID=2056292 RepID=A0AAD5YA01_9APHY|nr:hypothetical protein NLI96_g9623 [Physisporinus lineatus]
MSLLHYLSYVGAAAAFVFVTLSLASGLLWLSELIEEYSSHAKVIGQRGIYAIIFIHIILYLFDHLPLGHVLFSIACHAVYLQNITSSWPLISLTSWSFIASCVLVVSDHFMWFFYFARLTQEARHRSRTTYHGAGNILAPGFADIATFFGMCVWLAPLFLFLSLSANDNALPLNIGGKSSVPNTPIASSAPSLALPRPKRSLFKSLYDMLSLESLPRLRQKPKRDNSIGIIAPPSPNIRPVNSPSLRPVSPAPSLHRVPSIPSLPSSPNPPRRGSVENPNGPRSILVTQGPTDPFGSSESPTFQLNPPPRRAPGRPVRRSTTGESRLELRRAVSANSMLREAAL